MQGDGNKAQSSLLKNSCESLIQASASEALYVEYKSQLLMNELFTTKKRFKQTPFLSKKQKSAVLSRDRLRKYEKVEDKS